MTDPAAPAAGGDALDRLARFTGPPAEFWPAFFAHFADEMKVRAGLVAVRGGDGAWAQVVAWPATGPEAESGAREAMRRAAADAAPEVAACGARALEMRVEGFRGGGTLLGVRLPTAPDAPAAVLFVRVEARRSPAESEPALRLLRHAVSIVVAYEERTRVTRAESDAVRFGAVLDLLAALRAESRFVAAAMRLCNEVAGRYGCDRVSLGWRRGDYLRLRAVSHAESFEKRMDAVRRMETAMEEAFDQDEEIVWPAPAADGPIAREHEALAREQGARNVLSIPLRQADRPVGVLTCERARPFAENELGQLRLMVDQTAGRLVDLHDRDRWFGARWLDAARHGLSRFVEPRHTGTKLLAVAGAIVLALVFLLPVPFRVQTPFVVRAQTAVYLPAPFEGYLAEVQAEPGDRVTAGQVLLRLDTRELLLEEAAAIADRDRFLRESEKARAENARAAMRIAAAQAEQARVRLELTRHRLAQAGIAAPFDGVVMEGDLRERVGSPVRPGDTLLRVARLDALEIDIEIDQRDTHEVRVGAPVRLAIAGRPGRRIGATVELIEPLAQTRDRQNFFPGRCRLDRPPEDWMRPGMTGLGKVEAGRHSLAWIASRRTTDFLRLHLWW